LRRALRHATILAGGPRGAPGEIRCRRPLPYGRGKPSASAA
jgi:hypothetical protein